MKDGEVVFLIAGFAALAFLMTQDKSGKEEKPSQVFLDEFGPADEPMAAISAWEGSEGYSYQDPAGIVLKDPCLLFTNSDKKKNFFVNRM